LFINIDYNKRPKTSKLHLAKPNKKIISNIFEKMDDTVNIKLGNINEMTFTIPHFIDGEPNEHVDLIKERMLVRLTLDSYKEWYVIDSIEEDGDDTETFIVKAFSLGYENKGKRIPLLQEEAINAEGFLTKVLEPTIWTIGEIDPIFNAMFRSFDISNSNVLDCITQAGETFGALIVWDTENRKVSLVDIKKNGKFRGMTVNYGRFLQSIKRTRTTDELVTRLHIFGSEDLTIHSVNPTGMGYVEDFSYFMYPFERDAVTKETIKSSHFMSDELCHAILNHQEAVKANSTEITSLQNDLSLAQGNLIELETQLSTLKLELDAIQQLLDVALATEDTELIVQRKDERDYKKRQVEAMELDVAEVQDAVEDLELQISSLQYGISHEASFTPELLDELNLYIIESEWRDDRYADVQELYDDGIAKFEEIRQPKVVIDVTIDNLLNIVEEQYYWDKLILGDLIKVKYPQMNIEYMAKIIEINYDFGNEEVSVVIANTTDLLDDVEKLQQILYDSSSATSMVENNKYKWDKINAVEKEVSQIITQEWDANKNKIIAGVNNTVEVGNRGIIIKNPDFPQEVVIMQSGIIALSKDGGESWKTAIKPDGVVAERLIGQIIAGQELLITNSAGTFTFDANGVYIDANHFELRSGSGSQTVNLTDIWNGTTDFVDAFVDDNIITAYEKKMLKIEWDRLKAVYDSMVIRLNGYYPEDQGNSLQPVRDFHQLYLDLYNYLFVELQTDGHSLLDELNMAQSTRIDRVMFDRRFKFYDDARVKVDEILTLKAHELAQLAYGIADEAKGNIAEIENDIVWKIELHSSKGFTFKNGDIDTVITARVYRGKDNVTATIPNSGFIWKKYNRDGNIDQAWTDAHVEVGNVISVTRDDVQEKAIFSCDIDITE
jgi:phage minor structural protein